MPDYGPWGAPPINPQHQSQTNPGTPRPQYTPGDEDPAVAAQRARIARLREGMGWSGGFYSSPMGTPGLSGPKPKAQPFIGSGFGNPGSIGYDPTSMNGLAGGFTMPPGWRPAQVANQNAQTVTPYNSVQSTPTGHDPWGRW